MAMRLKDLAKQLGVSPSTISLTIHNRPGVSQETRQRIFDALTEAGMEKLIPSEPLRLLKNIRLVIYKNGKGILADTPFFMHLIEGIDRQAKAEGLNLLITHMTPETATPEGIAALAEDDCRGIIVLATEMTQEQIVPFKVLGLPLISLDNNMEQVDISSVAVNNYYGTYRVVEYLVKQGHTKIGYLRGDPEIWNFLERQISFNWGMQLFKLTLPENSMIDCPATTEGAYLAVKDSLLKYGLNCTAFIADSDTILFGALKALREYHIPVPERVSVVGFDDLPLAELNDPPLTTIHVPKRNMGAITVSLMSAMLNNIYQQPLKITINTRLMERESVAPALE